MRRTTRGKIERKRRLERRRRTLRKQRGGADSVKGWVSDTARFFKEKQTGDPSFLPNPSLPKDDPNRLGSYTFASLQDSRLTLPDAASAHIFSIDIGDNEQKDLRAEAASVALMWADVIRAGPEAPTPADFEGYVSNLSMPKKNPDGTITEPDPDMLIAFNHLVWLENKLRSQIEVPLIESLTESAKYPLFTWALLLNPPEMPVEPTPVMVPAEEVKKELLKITEPAST